MYWLTGCFDIYIRNTPEEKKMKYKLIIHGNNIYKEIILDENFSDGLMLGTEKNCQIGFRRDKFLTNFIIRVNQLENSNYAISCNDSIYFKVASGMKEYVKKLVVCEHIAVCYEATNMEFLYIDFFVEFDSVGDDYDLYIDCSACNEFTIGGNVNDTIRIDAVNMADDSVRIRKVLNGYEIDSKSVKYGITVNGFTLSEEIGFIYEGEFFSVNGYNFCIKAGYVYTTQNANVITGLPVDILVYQKNHFHYPEYIRNVRQQYSLPDEKIEILAPKSKDEAESQNFLLTVLPMLINMLLMVGLRGVMGGGGMFVVYFAATMTVSTSISIFSYYSEQKKRKEKENKREKIYMQYLSQREDEIIRLREKEKVIANQMHPRLEEYMRFIEDFDNRLFEKEKTHEDFLSVRMGNGIVLSKCQIIYKQEDYVESEDALKDYPRVMHDKYQYLNDMPIMIDLKDLNAVGFIGSRTKLYQIAKNLILSFSASHYYKDLKLYLIMNEEDVELFRWGRWLQIFYNDETNTRNFMYDEESRKFSLEFLYSELSSRESLGKTVEDKVQYLVFVFRSDFVNNHPVSKFICKAKELGFRFIFFEEFEELLNISCDKRIFLDQSDNRGYIQDVKDGREIQEFDYGHITKLQAEKAAKKLGCAYVDEINLENRLTKNITLFELLHIMTPYDLNLRERWEHSKIYNSMAAPIGVKSGNEIIYLDLHEKAHGPHGLVAGTTGSGKSEIMQTYILSMATLYHPYEVGFIIIDFKGGGMVNQFRNLPHLNGAITNIDGNEIERSLLSIKAELVKRQEIFAKYGVNHINDYIKLYKESKANEPLPHLILIVDEFAELKSEQPEFMKELISASRIGRSLGVHLILATQKPSGIVSDQIWSNSKFKLCLKVQNKNDSNEVIKSPLAAEIREPGRAYLQVGNNEIFQLFQSAYSGTSIQTGDVGAQKEFVISKIALSGQRTIIYEQKSDLDQAGETQLEAIVHYINEYCKNTGIKKLPDICLPPLPENISFTFNGYKYKGTDIVIPIGLVDDPSKQRQYPELFNVSQNNMYILGSTQSGKTNLLQTIIRALTTLYTPKDVNIYILDFASMILRNFSTLNHVGGVITASDDEKLKNLLKLIQNTIQERKNKMSNIGLSSYSAYRESGRTDMPQIVVLLDNWVAFRGYYPNYENDIMDISRECVAVGISLIVTASQTVGAGFKLLSSFSKRIALYCNDTSNYSALFEGCKKRIHNIPGRGIIENEKKFYECQYYLSFAAEKEYEKIKLMQDYIQEISKKYGDLVVKGIPEIPNFVSEQEIYKQFGKDCLTRYEVPLGLEVDSISVRKIQLDRTTYLGFLGNEDTGKQAYVKFMLEFVLKHNEDAPVELYILDNMDKSFSQFEKRAANYTNTMTGLQEIFDTVYTKLQGRYEKSKNNTINIEDETLLILVVNSYNLVKAIGTEKGIVEKFKDMVGKYKNMKICFLYTDIENTLISFSSGEALKKVRETKKVVAFTNIQNLKTVDIPLMAAREFKKELRPNEAYIFNGENIEKVRVIGEVKR